MKFYEFGEKEKPVIMLLPGTCCHWRNNFGHVISKLTDYFHVVCVSYDGFDENEKTEFIDMITETRKIESYIKRNLHGRVEAIYGCSLGGSFIGLLMQRNRIHLDHGIIGSSDLDQGSGFLSKLTAKILALLFHHALKKGRLNPRIVHIFEKRAGKEYTRQFLRMMFGNGARKLNFVTRKSIERQYYSDLETKLEEEIEVEGSKVHCIYANKMGEEYKKRYLKHFKDPDIIEYDMLHEELLACRPKEWVQLMEQIVGGERV